MKRILLALQFLTIIPLWDTGKVPEEEMGRTTAVFPVVGIIEGIITIVAILMLEGLPHEVTSALIILLMVIMNGLLHIDGLADTMDAIASRRDREERLRVMKDSRLGVAGVVSVVIVMILKYALITALLTSRQLMVIFLMPVMARWIMVISAFHGVSAKKEGLGRVFIEHTGVRELITATLIVLLSIFSVNLLSPSIGLFLRLLTLMMPILYVMAYILVEAHKRFLGGLTGDSLGMVYEIGALSVLLMGVIWL